MIQIPTHSQTFLVRVAVLALALTGVLAVGAIAATNAGAASSGGITTPGGGTDAGETTDSTGDSKYTKLWESTSSKDRRWASKTAECESGKDPDAIGGGGIYRGAFQFMKSTWKSSPKSPGGDPIAYPYRTQAVVAIALKNKDGAQHWPVCG